MRALSTILLGVALAQPVGAQAYRAPRAYSDDALWLTIAQGDMRAVSMSDRSSDGTWLLQKSKPTSLTLDWGRRDRSIGVRAARVTAPMQFAGGSCPSCAGDVQMLTMLATYRRASPLFTTGLLQLVEFGAGVTNWSGLKGRGSVQLPAIGSITDLTWTVGIGAGLPLGERLEAMVMYDVTTVRHPQEVITALGNKSSANVGLATLRFGARLRLGN